MADAPPAWALPALLRALTVGHRSHRPRVLRLLASHGGAHGEALSREPARGLLEGLLRGDDADLARGVGALVSSAGLEAFAPLLVDLLRRDDRRRDAERWLRRARFARPAAPLLRLAVDPAADLAARAAALRLLEGAALGATERALLTTTLAHARLHGPALRLLAPGATEDLVTAAVAANLVYGRALARRQRLERTGSPEPTWFQALLSRLWPDHDALGVHRRFHREQRDFVRAIARLAIAARSSAHLVNLLDHVADPVVGPALERAYVEQDLERVAGPLLTKLGGLRGGVAPAPALRLLGHLARAEALPAVGRHLPPIGAPAGEAEQAAIVALGRLLARTRQPLPPGSQLDLLLQGAVAYVRRGLGQPPGGAPGHATTIAACFEAGAALGDARVARAALDLLAAPVDVPEVGPGLAPALARLAPLELEPALERVLEAPDARPAARRAAVEVVGLLGLARQAPRVVRAARLEPTAADPAAHALAAVVASAPPDDVAPLAPHLEAVAALPGVSDPALDRLLEVATAALPADVARRLARATLAAGGGGRKARARALAGARQEPEPGALLELTLALLDHPHDEARTVGLELAFELDLLRATPPGAERVHLLLPRLVARALERHDAARWARRQVTLALDAVLPRGGAPGFTRDETDDLRRRLRQAGAWVSPATFHAAHRELLDLQARGVDVGLLHGAALALLARREVLQPKTGARGPYEGPLPRLERARAHPSPFVQEALWDVVAGPAYRRTLRLVLGFLASPRPRARAGALGLVPRDGVLAHEAEVLAALDDPAAEVREAAVLALARHELARFAAALRPRLEDPSDRVRLAAGRALAAWGDRGGLALVAAFLGAPDDALRREAVAHLARVEPADLVGVLAPHVSLERPRAAAGALAALRPDRGLPPDPALEAAVFDVAARGQGPLRAAALALLPQVVDDLRLGEVVPLLADADPHVRAAAAHVLRVLDGRPHAPAVARLAAAQPEPQVRRELLALLADLDVPEATRGLLPLVLDPDPAARQAALSLAGRLRGPSLRPELEALLRQGLELAAPPEALRDLVGLLDRTAGEDAAPALADALRCEERSVWRAVLEAARARGTDAHAGRLADLLRAARPLAPPLLTLALAEVARLGRRDLARSVEPHARDGASEAVRRAALDALAALDPEAGRATALEVARAAQARLAEHDRQPAARDRQRAGALRVARARVAGTLTSAGRTALSAARDRRTLEAALGALPASALGRSGPGVALARAAAFALQDGAAPALPTVGTLTAAQASEQLAWRLRDRVPPATWLERQAALTSSTPVRAALEPARLLARARAGAPLDAATLLRHAERDERGEDLAVGVAATWRPALAAGVVEARAAKAVAAARALPDDRWIGKARQAAGRVEAWGARKLRLGVRAGTGALVELAPELTQAGPGHALARLLAAEGDLPRLVSEVERWPEADRPDLLALVGEVGGAAAVEALGRLGAPSAPVNLRAAAAGAVALAGAPAAAEPHVARWLLGGRPPARAGRAAGFAEGPGAETSERGSGRAGPGDDPTVLAAALRAVERLALAGQGEAVLRLLGHADPTVQAAAADAAGALGLARARDALLALARGRGEAATPTAAVVLEHPGARPDDVVRTLREVLGLDEAAARALVAAPGAVAASGLALAAAEACRRRLQAVGARAVVRGGAAADAAAVDTVRLAAVRALERLPQAALVEGDPTPLVEALKGRAQADEFVERVARVLARMVGTERLDLVVGALLGEPNDAPVVAALRVLGRRERREAAPAILGLLTAGGEAVRAAAARALGDLGDPGALPALRQVVDGGGPAASRAAALRAALALLRRSGDAAGGRGLALARVDDAEAEVARAAADDLAAHPAAGQAPGDDVAGRLLAALRTRLGLPRARGARVDLHALREAWRGLSPALVEALSRAVLAQGDEALGREAADLVFAVVPALLGARALYVRADPAAHRERLRALATRPEAAWALPLLAEVDEAAAVVAAVGLGPRPRDLPPEAGLAAVRVVARRRLAATDDDERRALGAWLRPALLDPRAEVRRAARAGLEPGRFPDALAPELRTDLRTDLRIDLRIEEAP